MLGADVCCLLFQVVVSDSSKRWQLLLSFKLIAEKSEEVRQHLEWALKGLLAVESGHVSVITDQTVSIKTAFEPRLEN